MSKSNIQAHALAGVALLGAKDTKARLHYVIAGVKDGKMYDHAGTDYGVYDEDAEDVEFITDEDLALSRISGTKIASIGKLMADYFNPNAEEESKPEPKEDGGSSEPAEEIDYDAVAKACKKAIKKEDVKKATKLLAKLEGQDCYKKLSKKLAKVGK